MTIRFGRLTPKEVSARLADWEVELEARRLRLWGLAATGMLQDIVFAKEGVEEAEAAIANLKRRLQRAATKAGL